MYKNFKRFIALAALSLSFQLAAGHGKGHIPMSPAQVNKMEASWPRVVKVRPNQIGVDRLHAHYQKNGLPVTKLTPASFEKEFDLIVGLRHPNQISFGTLPTSVNNAVLTSFPPIGDQQEEGSCVAWGSTYYQASHELGLLNNYNNKNSFANVLSPRWTYNLLNGGVDGGLVPDTAFSLLSQNGAPSIVAFPYVDGNVTSWDLNVGDWENALCNRLAPAQYVTGIGGTTQDLSVIKQLLNNGHVLTFATFIDSWVFTQILPDPSNPNSSHVGQQAATYMNGTNGGHFMTIVGYDDTLWIDVNGNGQVDAGERGAFLVANSWGSSWGNQGYIWVSYDAYLNQSAVPNGPNTNRVAIASAENNYVFSVVPKAPNYIPKLIGQFSLTQSNRDQISIQAGVSPDSQMMPVTTFDCYALMNQGGNLEFDGSQPGNPATATFAVDMTDLLNTDGTTQNYYLVASDNTAGNPTLLSDFLLIDIVHNTHFPYKGDALQFDNSQVMPYIPYAFPNSGNTVPTVTINAPANNTQVSGSVTISVTATDTSGINSVSLLVDGNLKQETIVTPYQFTLDTTQLTNGSHQISVSAINNDGKATTQTISVTVANLYSIKINCGGSALFTSGMTYQGDADYTVPSGAYSNIALPASVYSTERYGTNFSYNFKVPNGLYNVQLQFEEIYFHAANQRVFSVGINNSPVISNLDLFKQKGYATPYTASFPVTVTGGAIHVHFSSSINNAKVSAIQITQTQ